MTDPQQQYQQPYAQPAQYVYLQQAPKAPSNGMAVAAVILGAVGFLLALIPIVGFFTFWIPALLGIIFGFIGLSTANRNGLNKPHAIWGIILGFAAGPAGFIAFMILAALGRATN